MDLKGAAQRLGVHYQTAYRWVREGALPASKIGTTYHISDVELERFARRRSEPAPPPRTSQVRSWKLQADRLFALLRDGDELACRGLVDRLRAGGVPPLALCQDLFAPALACIGDEWVAGRLSVGHEHRASAICERLLARVAVHPSGRPRGQAVVCTPPGEQHGLPATMAAIVLRADRWHVHHLGTEVPRHDLEDMVRTLAADIVVLSTVNPPARPRAELLADSVRQAGCRAMVGGAGQSLRTLVAEARAR